MKEGSPSSNFALSLLSEFVTLGVRNMVACPGSRSQALSLAAAELERAGLVSLSVRIDERVAGFLALGIAVESEIPVLVITTSGTAVANLMPAVLEAHHSGVPLILLTADRPGELHGIGSNQTTEQFGLFGGFVRMARDVEAPSARGFDPEFPRELARQSFSAAAGHSAKPGPMQVNLAFTEPLSGSISDSLIEQLRKQIPAALSESAETDADRQVEPDASLRSVGSVVVKPEPYTLVVAGAGAGEEAEAAARSLGAPLVAEVSSGAHFGPNLVVAYRELLHDQQFGARVRRVVVFGHPTLSREVPALISRNDVETIVVRGSAFDDYNPAHRVSQFIDGSSRVVFEEVPEPRVSTETRAWVGSWVAASRELLDVATATSLADARTDDKAAIRRFTQHQLAAFREPVTRRMLVESVWQKTWPHDRLVFGASRLIREADRVLPGKKIPVHANRGLSGIDGTVATAMGIALASQSSLGGEPELDAQRRINAGAGMTRALLGDLTLLHDVGALLLGEGEPAPRVQLIVGNDGGGTIFDALEVAATADPKQFDRVMFTPHLVNISALAEAYGWDYRLASVRGELDEALSIGSGRTIIEVPLLRN